MSQAHARANAPSADLRLVIAAYPQIRFVVSAVPPVSTSLASLVTTTHEPVGAVTVRVSVKVLGESASVTVPRVPVAPATPSRLIVSVTVTVSRIGVTESSSE